MNPADMTAAELVERFRDLEQRVRELERQAARRRPPVRIEDLTVQKTDPTRPAGRAPTT